MTSACPGEAVAMSGFLSLIVVMVSLFLVMGKIDGGDAAGHIRAGLRRAYPRRVHGARRRQLLRHRVFRKCGLPSHVRTRWIVRLDRLPLSCSPRATSQRSRKLPSRSIASMPRAARSANKQGFPPVRRRFCPLLSKAAPASESRARALHLEEHGRHAPAPHLCQMRGA